MRIVNISSPQTDIPRYPIDPYRDIRESVVIKERKDMYAASKRLRSGVLRAKKEKKEILIEHVSTCVEMYKGADKLSPHPTSRLPRHYRSIFLGKL